MLNPKANLLGQALTLDWVHSMGSISYDNASSVTTDEHGNVYTVGFIQDTLQGYAFAGDKDMFLSKHNTSGQLEWLQLWGGVGNDQLNVVEYAGDGTLYIGGHFSDTLDFCGNGIIAMGETDAFVAQLDTNGSCIRWKTAIGNASESIRALSPDNNGNVWVAGSYEDTLYADNLFVETSAVRMVWTAQLNNNNDWQWVEKIDGAFFNEVTAIRHDEHQNTYLTGYYRDVCWNGQDSLWGQGSNDIFIISFDNNGTIRWMETAGGILAFDRGRDIVVADDAVFITGWYDQDAVFGTDTLLADSEEGEDIFLMRMDTSGNLLWTTHYGGMHVEQSQAMAWDGDNIYIAGVFDSIFYARGTNISARHFNAPTDILLLRIDPDDGKLLWAEGIGDTLNDFCYDIALYEDKVQIVGSYQEHSSFPDPVIAVGDFDVFIVQYTIDTTIELHINDVVFDANNQLIKAYPNPCSDLLWIENLTSESDVEINLYNTTGQLLGVWQLNDNTQIDIESLNLAQGLYYLIAYDKYNRYQTLPVVIN